MRALGAALAIAMVSAMVSAKAMPPQATWPSQFRPARFDASTQQATGMSLDQAVAMVQARYGARAVKANTVEEDGRVTHYIRLISADRPRVWTVRVDAATGREY